MFHQLLKVDPEAVLDATLTEAVVQTSWTHGPTSFVLAMMTPMALSSVLAASRGVCDHDDLSCGWDAGIQAPSKFGCIQQMCETSHSS
jgi:hypothetical protein